MFKEDVLAFVRESSKLPEKVNNGDGAARMLSKILDISDVAVCNWSDLVPLRRAMQLDRKFRDKEVIKAFGLPKRGAPKFNSDLYE